MTFYFSFCASETDIMACGACKNMRKKWKDDCCFAEFFAPEDAEIFGKLKLHFPIIFMRKVLSDASTTKEEKKDHVQKWKGLVLFADLFSPEAKEIIVKIINEQGMEMVKTEVKLMLEAQEAAKTLLELKKGNQNWKRALLSGFQK